MTRTKRTGTVAAAVAACLWIGSAAQAAPTTTRVSIANSGSQANNYSHDTSVTPDGRYVAFTSYASNLVSGDTNGRVDVFVRDRIGGTTTRVSVKSSGGQGSGLAGSPSISANGRYVAFWSTSELVSGAGTGMNIYVRDRQASTTTWVSRTSSGAQANSGSWAPRISGDGRWVAYTSQASNLSGPDGNGQTDVFVYDRLDGTTELVSRKLQSVRYYCRACSVTGTGRSAAPSISHDGRYVAFESAASDLVTGDTNGYTDVFVRDRSAGTTKLVSTDSSGYQGNGHSTAPSISGDGTKVAFETTAWGWWYDANNAKDVYVKTLTNGQLRPISISPWGNGQTADGASYLPSISAGGRYVAFTSTAGNLVGIYPGTNHVYMQDLWASYPTLVSKSSSGVNGNAGSGYAAMADTLTAFGSSATNLIYGDTNGQSDIFVRTIA